MATVSIVTFGRKGGGGGRTPWTPPPISAPAFEKGVCQERDNFPRMTPVAPARVAPSPYGICGYSEM